MASINIESILAKTRKFMDSTEGKKLIDEATDRIILGSIAFASGGTPSSGPGNIKEAARCFIEILQNEIRNSAGTGYSGGEIDPHVIGEISGLSSGVPEKVGNGVYKIPIYFTGEKFRKSVSPERYPEGAHNIIDLLNAGYYARMPTFGEWNGKRIITLENRYGAHFIDRTIRIFMDGYARKYNVVDILLSDEYRQEP